MRIAASCRRCDDSTISPSVLNTQMTKAVPGGGLLFLLDRCSPVCNGAHHTEVSRKGSCVVQSEVCVVASALHSLSEHKITVWKSFSSGWFSVCRSPRVIDFSPPTLLRHKSRPNVNPFMRNHGQQRKPFGFEVVCLLRQGVSVCT